MSEKVNERKCIVAIRIRGIIRSSRSVRDTLQSLNLTKTHHAVLIDNRKSYLGMLRSAQNFLTWGEVTKETMNKLIRERGKIAGNKKLTDEYAQKIGRTSLNKLIDSIYNCNLEYWKLPDIQPVFKLHPPSKGFKGKIKKAYGMGGETGYRKEKINELMNRMI